MKNIPPHAARGLEKFLKSLGKYISSLFILVLVVVVIVALV